MPYRYRAKPIRPFTHDELLRFVKTADAEGESSIGTAAMIAYYWLQRKEDILTRLSWSHYRPTDAPDIVRIVHHKTGQLVNMPLYDDDETALWPELMQRLDSALRHGILIVTRDRVYQHRKVHLPWKEDYFACFEWPQDSGYDCSLHQSYDETTTNCCPQTAGRKNESGSFVEMSQ